MYRACNFSDVNDKLSQVNLLVLCDEDRTRACEVKDIDPRELSGSNTGFVAMTGQVPRLFSLLYEAMIDPELGTQQTILAMGSAFSLMDDRGESESCVIAIKPDGQGGRILSFVKLSDVHLNGTLAFWEIGYLSFTEEEPIDKELLIEGMISGDIPMIDPLKVN